MKWTSICERKPPHILSQARLPTVLIALCIILTNLITTTANEQRWKSNIAFGFNLSRGNTTNLLLHADLVVEKKGAVHEFMMGASIAYGETDEETTEENAKLNAQVNRLLTKQTYFYLNGEAMQNERARLDYRFTTGPGIGHYFLKTDTRTFSIELGVSYVTEQKKAVDDTAATVDDTMAWRLTQEFKGAIGKTANVWESAQYLTKYNDIDRYLLNGEIGIETTISGRLSLRLVVQDTYDSNPAPGVKNNDIVIKSSLVCNL